MSYRQKSQRIKTDFQPFQKVNSDKIKPYFSLKKNGKQTPAQRDTDPVLKNKKEQHEQDDSTPYGLSKDLLYRRDKRINTRIKSEKSYQNPFEQQTGHHESMIYSVMKVIKQEVDYASITEDGLQRQRKKLTQLLKHISTSLNKSISLSFKQAEMTGQNKKKRVDTGGLRELNFQAILQQLNNNQQLIGILKTQFGFLDKRLSMNSNTNKDVKTDKLIIQTEQLIHETKIQLQRIKKNKFCNQKSLVHEQKSKEKKNQLSQLKQQYCLLHQKKESLINRTEKAHKQLQKLSEYERKYNIEEIYKEMVTINRDMNVKESHSDHVKLMYANNKRKLQLSMRNCRREQEDFKRKYYRALKDLQSAIERQQLVRSQVQQANKDLQNIKNSIKQLDIQEKSSKHSSSLNSRRRGFSQSKQQYTPLSSLYRIAPKSCINRKISKVPSISRADTGPRLFMMTQLNEDQVKNKDKIKDKDIDEDKRQQQQQQQQEQQQQRQQHQQPSLITSSKITNNNSNNNKAYKDNNNDQISPIISSPSQFTKSNLTSYMYQQIQPTTTKSKKSSSLSHKYQKDSFIRTSSHSSTSQKSLLIISRKKSINRNRNDIGVIKNNTPQPSQLNQQQQSQSRISWSKKGSTTANSFRIMEKLCQQHYQDMKDDQNYQQSKNNNQNDSDNDNDNDSDNKSNNDQDIDQKDDQDNDKKNKKNINDVDDVDDVDENYLQNEQNNNISIRKQSLFRKKLIKNVFINPIVGRLYSQRSDKKKYFISNNNNNNSNNNNNNNNNKSIDTKIEKELYSQQYSQPLQTKSPKYNSLTISDSQDESSSSQSLSKKSFKQKRMNQRNALPQIMKRQNYIQRHQSLYGNKLLMNQEILQQEDQLESQNNTICK